MNILIVDNITKSYGVRKIFDGASFFLQEGEKAGIIGINGTGKSTLLKIAAGIEEPDEGQVIRANHIVVRYLPQNPAFDPELSVIDTVLAQSSQNFVGGTSGQDQNAGNHAEHMDHWNLESDAKAMMTKLGITDFEQKAGELSGGQRKRLALVAALLVPCDVLILDEPTVGLDPKQIIEIRDLIKELGKKHTIILSSHILSEISAVCDHVFIISHGKLVASDSTENLLERMTGAQEIELLVKAEEDTAETAIREVAQVERCEKTESKEDGAVQLLVTAKKDADVREAIYHTCVEHHMPILEMKAASKSLEDVFLELTSQEGGTK